MKTPTLVCVCLLAALAACSRDASANRTDPPANPNPTNTTPPRNTPTPNSPTTTNPGGTGNTGTTNPGGTGNTGTTNNPTAAGDTELAERVRRAIADDTTLTSMSNDLAVTAVNGAVTLRGSVRSQADKDALANKARGVAGVTSVANELTVRT